MEWEAIRVPLAMMGSALAAILLLMLVAKLVGSVNIEAKQGVKPIYSYQAEVKGKRTLVEADPDIPAAVKTTYFITFHKRDGNRVELVVPGEDYGLAAEGDEGILVCEGDDFVVFKRTS
ncbi:MAG: DUF2500 domain-containing protein [Clostridia bacterium]|nr:DUF2500 domain-containing protein [Clostridia bacterium]